MRIPHIVPSVYYRCYQNYMKIFCLAESDQLPKLRKSFRILNLVLGPNILPPYKYIELSIKYLPISRGKKYCSGVFLDISQAFNRVCHQGLLFKLKQFFPGPLYLIIKSYFSNRLFFRQTRQLIFT